MIKLVRHSGHLFGRTYWFAVPCPINLSGDDLKAVCALISEELSAEYDCNCYCFSENKPGEIHGFSISSPKRSAKKLARELYVIASDYLPVMELSELPHSETYPGASIKVVNNVLNFFIREYGNE